MSYILNLKTAITAENPAILTTPVTNAVEILKRDIKKCLTDSSDSDSKIILKSDKSLAAECYTINVTENAICINANDDLGFVYALLHISEKYLGVKPFWFWMDQKIEQKPSISIEPQSYKSKPYAVRFRGWFFNDEVLLLKWSINSDKDEPWRMAFEALLRCGGNMTIPGTDKTSRVYRKMASDMGLWITHHHAEPLGAEIFARAYPNVTPNFSENPELFYKLWESAVMEQKDCKVVWNLCFRGQGDKPFWSDDTTGRYNTPEAQGALISELIEKQCDIVKKHIANPVFCTNLYGEIMELYEQGFIHISPDIIKVRADNGYGKMVTRRRDNHSPRVSSMPEKNGGSQGIYYHVSFYDLQAANHITMLPNSVDFVNTELSNVLENDGNDFWVINCSNVRPHVYYLDAVRKKWCGEQISDESHSREFAQEYYQNNVAAAECLLEYPKTMVSYGTHEDEHAGEQLYTENSRILAHSFIRGNRTECIPQLRWLAGNGSLSEQTAFIKDLIGSSLGKLDAYLEKCESASKEILFKSTILLQSQIHAYSAHGLYSVCDAITDALNESYKSAFIKAGDAAEWFDKAQNCMRNSEYGVWESFYFNDCFADIKHSAYMARKLMGVIRELGDNGRHDKWYRDTVYAPEDRNVFLLLVLDNHMTDEELYKAMKNQ